MGPYDARAPPCDQVSTLVLHIDDADDSNFLDRLPEAVTFLHQALTASGVALVHCHNGLTLSPVVIAAWAMQKHHLAPEEALRRLQTRLPSGGFLDIRDHHLEQLSLWATMGHTVSPKHPAYRGFCLSQLSQRRAAGKDIDTTIMAEADRADARLYRCRACRRLLCGEGNVVGDEAAVGWSHFRYERKASRRWNPSPPISASPSPSIQTAATTAPGAETSSIHRNPHDDDDLFSRAVESEDVERGDGASGNPQVVGDLHRLSLGAGMGVNSELTLTSSSSSALWVEPMAWMEGITGGETSGKLYCPGTHCRVRLGHFNWSGLQNDRGQWVTPAFQLHLSKLDVIEQRDPLLTTPAIPSPSGRQQPATTTVRATNSTTSDGSRSSSRLSRPFAFVVFDCDGVLVDSEPASCESLVRAVLEVTGCHIPNEYPRDFLPVQGMDVRGCLRYYQGTGHVRLPPPSPSLPTRTTTPTSFRAHGLDSTEKEVTEEEKEEEEEEQQQRVDHVAKRVSIAKARLFPLVAQEMGGIRSCPGIERVLQRLRDANIPYGIASSGSPKKIKTSLTESGLLAYFHPSRVVSTDMVPRAKPHPDVYLEAIRRVKLSVAQSSSLSSSLLSSSDIGGVTTTTDLYDGDARWLVVEDTVHGLRAAKSAGAYAVGVTHSMPAEMLRHHADLVVDHLEELLDVLAI